MRRGAGARRRDAAARLRDALQLPGPRASRRRAVAGRLLPGAHEALPRAAAVDERATPRARPLPRSARGEAGPGATGLPSAREIPGDRDGPRAGALVRHVPRPRRGRRRHAGAARSLTRSRPGPLELDTALGAALLEALCALVPLAPRGAGGSPRGDRARAARAALTWRPCPADD